MKSPDFFPFPSGRRKKWRGKLIYEYIFLLIAVACIIIISFWMTRYIVKYSAMEQSRQSLDVIFQQAEERIKIFEEDIESLHMNVLHSSSVQDFFQAGDMAGRWDSLEGFYQVVGNNRRINRNLQNILLYDASGELIAAKGDVYLPRPEDIAENGLYTYSDCMTDKKTKASYFEVGMPVFERNLESGYHQIGSVYLLFDVKYLQSIVDSVLPNEKSAVGILDGKGNLAVSAGDWKEEYALFNNSSEDDGNLIHVHKISRMGWRMISVVPKHSMLSGVTQMQKVNYITYLVVLFVMCLVCATVYRRIIKPISRQTSFMADFTRDTGQRIEVTGENEISEMARKMNEMLDDIEALNREIVDSQKKYLEQEYARKQTEMIAYKSQINPHFLYNTFNCIRGMALYKGEREIAELTMSLSCFFRYSVQGDEMVTVAEALENLSHYSNIIRCRFNGKHQVNTAASKEVLEKRIPKLLIQPLVENAVLHGLEMKPQGGRVFVEITETKKQGTDKLAVIVKDDGDGIDTEKLRALKDAMERYDREGTISEKGLGIGFLNVYRRLRLFYGQAADFELESAEGKGTRIRMWLPVGQDE